MKKAIILLIIFSLVLTPFGKSGFFVAKAETTTAGDDLTNMLAQATAATATCLTISISIRLIKKYAADIFNLSAVSVPVGTGGWMDAALEDAKKCFKSQARKIIMDWTVNQITDWIQNGGDLGARFTMDWQKDTTAAWRAGAGEVINDSTFSFLCSPFKLQAQMAFMPVEKFSKRISCTLDTIAGNYDNFMADFNNGGWLAYNAMWEPQNNYFGAVLLINDEATKRATGKQSALEKDLAAGQGFKSGKSCKITLKATDPIEDPWEGKIINNFDEYGGLGTGVAFERIAKGGNADSPKKYGTTSDVEIKELLDANVAMGKIVQDSNGRYCYPQNLENATPGRLVGDMMKTYLVDNQASALSYLGEEDDLGKWAEAIVNAATNRLMKEVLSLMKPGSSSSGSSGASGASNTSPALGKAIQDIVDQTKNDFKVEEFANSTSSEILAKASSSLSYAKEILLNYEKIDCYQKGFGNDSGPTNNFDIKCASLTGIGKTIARSGCSTVTVIDINTASSTRTRLDAIVQDGQSLRDLSAQFLSFAEEAFSTKDVKKFSKKTSLIISNLAKYISYPPQSLAVKAMLNDIDDVNQTAALNNAIAENNTLSNQKDSSTTQLTSCSP